MKKYCTGISTAIAVVGAFTLFPIQGCGISDRIQIKTLQDATVSSDDRSKIDGLVSDFPPRPRLAARQMMAQYGLPEEATTDRLVWHNHGPYKRITVTRAEHHHDFPLPHTDYVEHTINYRVPADKAAALSAYDGSLTFDRTRGEMSARCDVEGHNILALNLAHDIVRGKMNQEEARRAFARTVEEDFQGKHPGDVMALRIDVPDKSPAFADQPVIPGSPKRESAIGSDTKKTDDAEILAFLSTVNINEILAADQATKQKIDEPVMQYAPKLHQEHGNNFQQTLMLGQRIGVTPILTLAIDKWRVNGARELADIVPLNGDRFSKAYLRTMIKSHTEVLMMIDTKLKNAEAEEVKKHLTATRQDVERHIDEAKRIQNSIE